MSAASAASLATETAIRMADYYDDPLNYVREMYDWGSGELQHSKGPDTWQTEALIQIGREVKERSFDGHTAVVLIRFCRASGHDIGKTTFAAWIVNWIKDTRPDSQGTVTANTFKQLETKTWAAIKRWARLGLTRDLWKIGATKMYHREAPDTWFCGVPVQLRRQLRGVRRPARDIQHELLRVRRGQRDRR